MTANTNGTNTQATPDTGAAIAAWETLVAYWIAQGVDPIVVRRFIPHPSGDRKAPPGLERVTVTLLGALQGSKKVAAVSGSELITALQTEREAVKADLTIVASVQGKTALAKAKTGGK
jgi:hypothetical protein